MPRMPLAQKVESQHVEQAWETPSLDAIPQISKQHVIAMETVDDDNVWTVAGMEHLLLRTVGRRSGQEHKVALPMWRDADGNPVVVASFAGAPQHPSWYLNLADPTANPELHVRTRGGAYWAEAQVLDGADYDAAWEGLTADRAWYRDYQARTERRIPLVRFVEKRPA